MCAGALSLQCRWPAVVGRARVCPVGWGGAVRCVHEAVFPVSARGGSGPWEVLHARQQGAAEGTEDFVHKGRVCRLGLRLSADGALQLLAQRQRPDLWIAKTGHRSGAVGVSAVRSRWGMASSCCRPSRWNLHVADNTLVCGQRHGAHRQRQ